MLIDVEEAVELAALAISNDATLECRAAARGNGRATRSGLLELDADDRHAEVTDREQAG